MLFLSTASGWEHSRALDFSVCRSYLGKGFIHFKIPIFQLGWLFYKLKIYLKIIILRFIKILVN
ncbi:hypothetical protein EIQ61_08590 [Campylobacter jejuni]|nr:hypothetical protein [Campylobacter jejuni]